MTTPRFAPPPTRLDDAARAGWLYYVAGNTQDEIAHKLGVSRQTAQRLVAMAVSERLVKVRLDHPIGRVDHTRSKGASTRRIYIFLIGRVCYTRQTLIFF